MSRPSKSDPIAATQRVWKRLFILAAWLIAAASSFLTFPVQLSQGATQGSVIAGFTQTLIASVCGLTLLAAEGRQISRRRALRSGIPLACLIVLITSILAYVTAQTFWTCRTMDGSHLVMGNKPSMQLEQHLRGPQGEMGCEIAVAQFQGRTFAMYEDHAQIVWRFLLLAVLYMVAWAALCVLVVTLGLALSDQKRRGS